MWYQVKEALDQSTQLFLTRLANLLPGIVALIVALVISIILAVILVAIVQRLLTRMHFDERLSRSGFASIGTWSASNSPSLVISRVIGCLVILSGFLVGVAAFDADSSSLMLRTVFSYVPNVIGAILVLAVGTLLSNFVARSVLIGSVNMNFQYGRLLSVGVKWLVMVLAVAMALEHLRISPGIVELAFGILFGGIVLTLALGVGLNSRELLTKSLERDPRAVPTDTTEDPLRHL